MHTILYAITFNFVFYCGIGLLGSKRASRVATTTNQSETS